jgi:pimeloyl-ACP methyl ester carboxylesterase
LRGVESAQATRTIELPQGTLALQDSGSGEPLLFVHGLLVDGRLWRKVVPRMEGEFRCLVPDLPLGSHRIPMSADADLTPPGLARMLIDLVEALDLDRVTLVGNDTGGAISQIAAADHPSRVARLVLTPCDAFDNFLPPAFRPLQYAARVPGALTAALQSMRVAPVRRLPFAFGWLIKHDPDGRLLGEWVRPFLSDGGIRRDTIKVLKGISPRYTNEAAERLRSFDRPTMLAWAREDRFFKASDAERLAQTIPGARLEWIEDSYTFVPEDQPARLTELLRDFVGST